MSGSGSVAGTLNIALGQTRSVVLDYTVEPGGVSPPPAATVAVDNTSLVSLIRGTLTAVNGSTTQFTETIEIVGNAVGTTTVHAINSGNIDESDFVLTVIEPPADNLAWDPSTLS